MLAIQVSRIINKLFVATVLASSLEKYKSHPNLKAVIAKPVLSGLHIKRTPHSLYNKPIHLANTSDGRGHQYILSTKSVIRKHIKGFFF